MDHTSPIRFSREPLISTGQIERVHALAKQILAEIGLQVGQPEIQASLKEKGVRFAGERACFAPRLVDEYVEEMRRRIATASESAAPADEGRLSLVASSYSLFLHDLETDTIMPSTSQQLIEMCKLIDSLAEEGVSGTPPGIPTEEPPDLHAVAQYRLAALYARQGSTPVNPTSAKTVNHLLDMAEVMGKPVRSLPVYLPTPLRLGGESLAVVLACQERLERITVSSMPSSGATAPLQPFGALALGAAELIGGMIAMHLLTGKPVSFQVNIFPFDLRTGAMVFGSPENFLFQMLSNDVNRFYGWAYNPAPDNIHVMAKLPNAQSAAEKAAILTTGALLGARSFSCAGTLSLDDIFSPVQLLIDCEIRDWAQRAIQGMWPGEQAVDDWLAEMRAGIQRGFMRLDSTLDYYNQTVWHPQRFERRAVNAWLSEGQPRLDDRLRAEVRRRIAACDYELDAYRRQEIERIYQAARRAVLG